MFCTHCGSQTSDALQYCTNCGQPLQASTPAALVPFEAKSGEVRIGYWFSAGWDVVKQDLATWILITLLFLLLNGVPLLQGPLLVGIHIAAMRKKMLGRVEVGDLFKGFNYFLPAMIAGLVISVLGFVGLLLCIIPGIVVYAMYKFTWIFIVDKRMDFWPAMQASHEVVKKNGYSNFVMFMFLASLINFAAVLLCIVPVLITIPVTMVAITQAYDDLVGFEKHGETLGTGVTF